jgi:hypothetical protein
MSGEENRLSAVDAESFAIATIALIVFFSFLFLVDFNPPSEAQGPPAWVRADAEVLATAWARKRYQYKAGYRVLCNDDGIHPISQCVVYLNAQGKKSEVLLDCMIGAMAPHGCEEVAVLPLAQ